MNAKNFTKLLKNPADLHKLPYATIKELVEQYPYCQNLRYLLLKKCAFDESADYEEALSLAATFSNDRNLLLKQVNFTNELKEGPKKLDDKQIPEITEISKDELANSEKEATEVAPLEKNPEREEELAIGENLEIETVEESPVYYDESEFETEIEDITEEVEIVLSNDFDENTVKEPEEDYEKVISFEELIELDSNVKPPKTPDAKTKKAENPLEQPNKKSVPKDKKGKPVRNKKQPPTPKTSFSSWVKQFQEAEALDKKKSKNSKKRKLKKELPVSKIQKKKNQAKKKVKAASLAEKSLKENKEIVSETLANILASQGSYEKAIEMFEKLSLIIPEKSSYFADRIKKLKNN